MNGQDSIARLVHVAMVSAVERPGRADKLSAVHGAAQIARPGCVDGLDSLGPVGRLPGLKPRDAFCRNFGFFDKLSLVWDICHVCRIPDFRFRYRLPLFLCQSSYKPYLSHRTWAAQTYDVVHERGIRQVVEGSSRRPLVQPINRILGGLAGPLLRRVHKELVLVLDVQADLGTRPLVKEVGLLH